MVDAASHTKDHGIDPGQQHMNDSDCEHKDDGKRGWDSLVDSIVNSGLPPEEIVDFLREVHGTLLDQ